MGRTLRSIISSLAIIVFTLIVSVGASYPVSAASAGCQENKDAFFSAGELGIPTYGCGGDSSIVETVLKLVFGALAMIALLFIVIGGFKYTISGGDSNAIASAKKTITYAVLGLVLGLSVFTIIGFIFSWLER